MRKGGRGDPEVVRPENFSTTGELGPYFCVDSGNRLCDRHRAEHCEQMLDEGSTPRSNRTACAMNAVQELAYCDDADRGVLLDRNRFRGAAFAVDQDARVDQDRQELSAGPTSDRMS